jgi:predicted CXXCH cytochrome family protein
MQYRHLHWSDFDGVGECQKCHASEGEEHEFTTDDSSSLCVSCHEELTDKIEAAETVHEPLEEGCLDCHDPHGGEVEALLAGVVDDDVRTLCFECHEDEILEQEFAHGPADQGACHMCHDPHASNISPLLLGQGLDLCGDCHEEIAEEIETAEYVHDPVEEGCIDCHGPHGGPYPKMLQAEKRQLCNECHDDVVETAENSDVDHGAVLTEDECLNCHSPHASNNAPNLKKPQRDLCLGCHDRPVESGDAVLTNMQELLLENKEWHEPVVEDNCSGCHQPHGSQNFRLLVEPYPARLYSKFSIDNYALCFSCHKKALVTVQWTRTLTGFRDGDRNMHFLHVNKPKRGRSCRACHEVHASPHPLHIRERTPYGKWNMPIKHRKNETGGSCHPGCHKLKTYDRNAKNYPDKE